MLYHQITEEKKEKNQLILDVFEMTKPWLDKELWSQIEKNKPRVNVEWGKKKD